MNVDDLKEFCAGLPGVTELMKARGEGSAICADYKPSRGPAIPLNEDAHEKVTADQREYADQHRKAGTQPTYSEARERSKEQMKKAGANGKEAECIMKFTDEVIRQLCPGLIENNMPLRTPAR